MTGLGHSRRQATSAYFLCQEVLGREFPPFSRGILPKASQPWSAASIFCVDKRSRICFIPLGYSKLHATCAAVLRPFRTISPLSHPGISCRIPSADPILHRFVPAFRRPYALRLRTWVPAGRPAGPLDTCPTLRSPLRGRLEVSRVGAAGLLEDMVHLFGGIRFWHIVLFNVTETQLLLTARAETLETLQLYPTDPRGKQRYVKCLRFPGQRSCG